jgi:uncharacterized membrane-anchored protein YjiN (DUF445 family)
MKERSEANKQDSRLMDIRYLAPLSLAIATCGFAVTFVLPDAPPVGYLRSFCEAAMVGGLADWFAVVALFRRPLGLPIPGTAIIPRKKKEIDQAIVGMVKILMPPQTIISKIAGFDIIGKFIALYGDEAKRNWLLEHVSRTLHSVLKRVPVKDVTRIMNEFLGAALKQWAPRISEEISMYLAANYPNRNSVPEKIFGFLLQEMRNFVRSDGSVEWLTRALEEHVAKETLFAWLKWFRLLSVQDLAEKLISIVSNELELEKKGEPNSLRKGYKQLYKNLTNQLHNRGSQTSRTIDHWWNSVAGGPQMGALIERYLNEYLTAALEDLGEDESRIRRYLERGIGRFVDDLRTSQEFRSRATDWINHQLSSLVLNHHDSIGEIVTDTLESFSDKKLVSLIEDKVGGDLQYIRLNGALVGGLVGVTIHFVKAALI